MKTVVVLSGKGGTGKTSVTASLAALETGAGTRLVLADGDVDAANLPLLLQPEDTETQTFVGGEIAVVDADLCNGCTLCHEHCRFGAIRMVPREGGPELARILDTCEGCAVCSVVCPEEAIVMQPRAAGTWAVGTTRFGPLVHATLSAGGETSGKLVTQVRKRASELAGELAVPLVLVDGPPGIGCPVIAAMSGVDLVVAVTEPTPSARADLERLLTVAGHFEVPVAAVLNKADLNDSLADELARDMTARGVTLLGRVPYDPSVVDCQRNGLTPPECGGPAADALLSIQRELRALLGPLPTHLLPVFGAG